LTHRRITVNFHPFHKLLINALLNKRMFVCSLLSLDLKFC